MFHCLRTIDAPDPRDSRSADGRATRRAAKAPDGGVRAAAYPGATGRRKHHGRDPLASTSIWLTDLPGRNRPKLLIVIPFKDQVEMTIQCLESIERQEHGLDVVVALVNNGSVETWHPAETTCLDRWVPE